MDALHPTDQTLSSYGLGKLDDPSAEAVNKHLEACPDCRKRVAEMSSDSFLDRVRDAQKQGGPSQAGGTKTYKGSPVPVPPRAETMPPGLADHPDYEIKKELGRGGMGVVYLAHNKLMGRDEVLKVMGWQIMERPGVLERFLREIRAVAKLRHPNIVTAYSAIRLGESLVFAMEYVEGLDLSKMVKAKGPLPVAHACNFVYQAALGLQHAHEEGLVHRDIKPANLMLSRKGDKATVKVLDFGLAKAAREEKLEGGLTSEGQALGTPDYIAPEQILNAPDVDIRADIYSLGGTLYYLLTGRPPFKATSLYDMYQAHISRDADPLNLVRPEVPAELAALVAKMMAKDPARRFQTPGEVAEALKPFFRASNESYRSPRPEVSQVGQTDAGRLAATPTQPGTEAGAGAASARKEAESSVAESRWESLVDFREEERSVDSAPSDEPTRRPPWVWPAVASGGLLFGLLFVLGVIIRIRTKDGEEVVIHAPEKTEITIETGSHNPPGSAPASAPSLPASEPSKASEASPRQAPSGTRGTTANGPSDTIAEKSSEAGLTKTDRQDGFVSLFNGKDLAGWKSEMSNGTEWAVVDGILRCRGPKNRQAILATVRRDFRDFDLRVIYRCKDQDAEFNVELRLASFGWSSKEMNRWRGFLSDRGQSFDDIGGPRNSYMVNGGAWPITARNHWPVGTVAKFSNQVAGWNGWVAQAEKAEVPANAWNTLEIIVLRNRITCSVNGKQVSDYTDVSDTGFALGAVSLLTRSGEDVEFKTIAIRPASASAGGAGGLPTGEVPTSPTPAVKPPVSPGPSGRHVGSGPSGRPVGSDTMH
jgi:serine/threonine protein kinase